MINGPLLRHTWRSQRLKLLAVAAALVIWGALLPVIYASFGVEIRKLVEAGVIPQQLLEFGGGNVFSLPGAVALGFIHPIAVFLLSVFAVGFGTSAVAGERQRGTLEVLLARPLSRRSAYWTLLIALTAFLAIGLASQILGTILGSAIVGVSGELGLGYLPLLWLNGLLLNVAFGTIALAASVSFDRLTPALGLTLAILLLSYFFEILGSLWPDAQGLQPYSLFHYLQPQKILIGRLAVSDLIVLAGTSAFAIAYALGVFPRRDLAAPS